MILGFAGIGVVVNNCVIGMQTGSFNVPGSIDNRNAWFGAITNYNNRTGYRVWFVSLNTVRLILVSGIRQFSGKWLKGSD